MKSSIAHNIKHREKPNDEFETPKELATYLFGLVPFNRDDAILDPAYGTGNFYFIGPKVKDFYKVVKKYDWLITNPPYSHLDTWLEHSCKVSHKGFAYLLGLHNLTPKRIEACERQGFYITKIHLCKVFKWFGISAFVIWEKDKKGIIEYDRKVWH